MILRRMLLSFTPLVLCIDVSLEIEIENTNTIGKIHNADNIIKMILKNTFVLFLI